MVKKSPPKASNLDEIIVRARSHCLKLGLTTKIMGIVNVTPDSFSEDGQYKRGIDHRKAIRYGKKLIRDGAHILDIGGESSRPGSKPISVHEEIKRVVPVIEALAATTDVPISVDTYKSSVATEALKAGASIVNNIMGTALNKSLLRAVERYSAAIVLMHIRGKPRTMQKNVNYNDVIGEISQSLQKSIENCLEIGIKSDRIIIDPGIGFGKSVFHNLVIINRLDAFKTLNYPLLIGTSRKSFIGKILDREVHLRLNGTIATVCTSILRGADIVRVHDVRPIREAVHLTDAILHENENLNLNV